MPSASATCRRKSTHVRRNNSDDLCGLPCAPCKSSLGLVAGLIILERAMANVNRGQGVGFAVGGVVVDKKMLKLIGAKVGAGGWA